MEQQVGTNWNEKWQTSLQRGYSGIYDGNEGQKVWLKQTKQLLLHFDLFCKAVTKRIVAEMHFDSKDKTLPQYQARGRTIYEWAGVCFYTSDLGQLQAVVEAEHKSAGNELRHMIAAMEARIPFLHSPLSTVVDFRGHRFTCTAKAPISYFPSSRDKMGSTLVHGATTRGVIEQSLDFSNCLSQLAAVLNITPHTVNDIHYNIKQISTSATVQGHWSSAFNGGDDRLYVCSLSHLLPGVPPITFGGSEPNQSHHKFRPEYVRDEWKGNPLCADAFCGVGKSCPDHHDLDIANSWDYLISTTIPKAANAIDAYFQSYVSKIVPRTTISEIRIDIELSTSPVDSVVTSQDLFAPKSPCSPPEIERSSVLKENRISGRDIVDPRRLLHKSGVNMRYLVDHTLSSLSVQPSCLQS